MEHETAGTVSTEILDAISEAVIADQQFLRTTLTGILARGHVLLEDVPGTGKTLTAQSFATALGLSFQRIQFTPDLLPADITGSNIYNDSTGEFEFSKGPVFANVVLADEINRAPPKTQAALLEAMGEKQVTVDGDTYQLPEPFFVIATQNPVEQEGTFGLPEAQRDRFIIKTSLGYPSVAGERTLLDRRADRDAQTPSIEPVLDTDRLLELQALPEQVDVDERLRDYIIDLGRFTRQDQRVDVGISPRGVQRLFEAARARAAVAGRSYVVPDDIKEMVGPVFAHRIILTADASVRNVTPWDVINDAFRAIEVPAVGGSDGSQHPSQGDSGASRQRTNGHPDPTQQGQPRQAPNQQRAHDGSQQNREQREYNGQSQEQNRQTQQENRQQPESQDRTQRESNQSSKQPSQED